jgi:hypothetical protein
MVVLLLLGVKEFRSSRVLRSIMHMNSSASIIWMHTLLLEKTFLASSKIKLRMPLAGSLRK